MGKEPGCKVGDTGDGDSISGSKRSPGGGHGNPLQGSCLENPWTEEPGGLPSMGHTELDTTEETEHTRTHVYQVSSYFLPLRGYGAGGSELAQQ